MTRIVVRWLAITALVLSVGVPPARAQDPGAVARFTGTLSSDTQQDHIAFELNADLFTLNASGAVTLVFIMSGGPGSFIDPGLISVVAGTTGRVGVLGPGKPDTADSTASLALASLTPGAYDIVVRSEHRTTGPYRLDIFLAGDVNGDQKVDDADIGMVAGLAGVKAGAASYVALADVDRNGVIDGGDRERAEKNAGAMAGQIQAGNPLDTFLPADALTLVGASPEGFNSRKAPLRFRLVGAKFDVENVADFSLTINGDAVATHLLAVDAHLLTANVGLADGRNDIALKAYDTVGRPLYFQRTLWAGSATLHVKLVNPDGSPFLQSATVAAVLSDDEVAQQARTTTGTAVFKYVPSRTILVKAQGAGNQTGTAGVIGSQGVVTITMGGGTARPIGRP